MKFATNLKTRMSGADSHQAQIYEAHIGNVPFVIRKVVLMRENATPAEAQDYIWGKEEDMRKFVDELKFWRRASVHPYIVELLSWTVGWKSRQLCAWMAMPRINGRTLRQSCTVWRAGQEPVQEPGGLTNDADKALLEKWILQVEQAVDFLHREGIAHDSLHTRNVMLEAGGQRNAIVIDFGRCIDLRSPKLTDAERTNAKHADLLNIVHLYVFGRPAPVNDKASAEVRKSQKAALDAWQRDQRERWFVKGVLTAAPGTITANQIACMPFFEGDEKDLRGGAKSSWAVKTPKEDKFHPTGPSL
ncbi:hypothetical protein AAVH_33662 [Aphelenchoides avenae]|nr:hypothetical protein AAVH_33662 [Aphelenchus avenae]